MYGNAIKVSQSQHVRIVVKITSDELSGISKEKKIAFNRLSDDLNVYTLSWYKCIFGSVIREVFSRLTRDLIANRNVRIFSPSYQNRLPTHKKRLIIEF